MARRKPGTGGGTPATDALTAAGVAYTPVEYDHHAVSAGYGLEAARETGLDPAEIFKTLIVTMGPRQLAVAVVPVAGHLDLKAMAQALGAKKVEMADPAVAERSSGYVVGGVSPIGQRTRLPTVIDESARSLAVMYVSGGKRGLQVGLAPADLAAVTGASFAPIGR